MGLLKNTLCIINFLHLGGNFQLTERMEEKSNKYPRCIHCYFVTKANALFLRYRELHLCMNFLSSLPSFYPSSLLPSLLSFLPLCFCQEKRYEDGLSYINIMISRHSAS